MKHQAPLLAAEACDPEQAAFQLETDLMASFRDTGTEKQFKLLYECSHQRLLAWIRSALRSRRFRLDPLEVLQDTFVNIFRYAGSFRNEQARSFRVWSRTIALNQIRHARRQSWRPSLQDLPEGLQEPQDCRCKPDDAAEFSEERKIMTRSWNLYLLLYLAAWKELSERDQQALVMVEVDGLSYAEACKILNVRMSNMKMIIFRARRRIRERLQGSLEELQASSTALLN